MNATSVMLIIDLVAKGIGVCSQIAELAQRVKNGDEITEEEIEAARVEINKALEEFDDEAPDDALGEDDDLEEDEKDSEQEDDEDNIAGSEVN